MSVVAKKWILIGMVVTTSLLMFGLTQPRTVDRGHYDQSRLYLMSASGLMGIVIIARQVFLGIRPMFARWITDFFAVNWLHKWLGIATLSALLLHPIAVVISYATSRVYAFSMDISTQFEVRVTVGKIAFDMILVVLASSIISRKLLSHIRWYWLHLLSYPAYIGIRLHGWFTGSMIAEHIGVRIYRLVLGVLLVVATIWRILYQFGFGKTKACIVKQMQCTANVYEMTLQLPCDINYMSGQFFYVQVDVWGTAHPFTVLDYDSATRRMRITYKVFGAFTQDMSQLPAGTYLYLDGPYGTFTADIAPDDRVVCIGSGIGVTPFYQLISSSLPYKKLIYLCDTRKDILYRLEFEKALGAGNCTYVLSRESQPYMHNEITGTRITADILQSILGDDLHRSKYYICGGPGVVASICKMLQSLGVHSSRIEREPFGM